MKNAFIGFFHFLLFLFAAEDSSQSYGGANIQIKNIAVVKKVKCLFWLSLSIAFSLVISQLH